MKSKEYYAGYRDFSYGQTTNPYDEDTEQYEDWQQGFDAAEDDEAALEHCRKYARHRIQRGYVADGAE